MRGDHDDVGRRNRRAGPRMHQEAGLALSAVDAFSMDLAVGGLMELEPHPANVTAATLRRPEIR
jgi:hypothetical protein